MVNIEERFSPLRERDKIGLQIYEWEAVIQRLVGVKKDLEVLTVTPFSTVMEMLSFSNATEDDLLVDLGSGDGRIPIAGALHYSVAKAMGIEMKVISLKHQGG